MKTFTMHKCDFCEFMCSDSSEMMKHEAGHFGLTVEQYEAVRANVSYCNYLEGKLTDNEPKYIVAYTGARTNLQKMAEMYDIAIDMFKRPVKEESSSSDDTSSNKDIEEVFKHMIKSVEDWGKHSAVISCEDVVRMLKVHIEK